MRKRRIILTPALKAEQQRQAVEHEAEQAAVKQAIMRRKDVADRSARRRLDELKKILREDANASLRAATRVRNEARIEAIPGSIEAEQTRRYAPSEDAVLATQFLNGSIVTIRRPSAAYGGYLDSEGMREATYVSEDGRTVSAVITDHGRQLEVTSRPAEPERDINADDLDDYTWLELTVGPNPLVLAFFVSVIGLLWVYYG